MKSSKLRLVHFLLQIAAVVALVVVSVMATAEEEDPDGPDFFEDGFEAGVPPQLDSSVTQAGCKWVSPVHRFRGAGCQWLVRKLEGIDRELEIGISDRTLRLKRWISQPQPGKADGYCMGMVQCTVRSPSSSLPVKGEVVQGGRGTLVDMEPSQVVCQDFGGASCEAQNCHKNGEVLTVSYDDPARGASTVVTPGKKGKTQ